MIYFNTVKLDSQSRLYIDSKIREALDLKNNDMIDMACVGNAIVLTSHNEDINVADTVEISNILRRLNNCITKQVKQTLENI